MSVTNEVKEFYSNDIVYRFDKRKRINFGVVVDSYEGSTDPDDCSTLQQGQIRVWWLNSSRESVWKQSKVRLMSRIVIPGDIVRRLENGKETQRGYCKESRQYDTVQIVGTDWIIEQVSSERLCTVTPYDANAAVCLGKKYGRIQSIDQKVTMQSKCGSTVEILSSINHEIEDYWLTKRNQSYFDSFYPGQEVTCVPNSLEQPTWITRSKLMKRSMQTRQRFTVQKVEPTDIEIAWYDCASSVTLNGIKAEDIKKLHIIQPIENAHLELGERRLLKLNSSDFLIKKRNWIRNQSALHQPELHKVIHIVNKSAKKERAPKFRRQSLLSACVNASEPEEDWSTDESEPEEISDNGSSSSTKSPSRNHTRHFPPKLRELTPGHTIAVEVLCTDSKATVVWQDGTEEKDIPTTQLYYSISLDDHEFFPGEWVIHEGAEEGSFGVIQQVNHLERTATVKWFKPVDDIEKPLAFSAVLEKSVYDLSKHPKYAFRPGIVVKHIPVQENKLGSVLDSCPEGYVVVEWIDGTKENCWPQHLELIPETIDFEYSLDDDDSAQVSWETESIESVAGDLADETTLQNVAARLDFVRGRVIYLKDILKQHNSYGTFSVLKELLIIYDNSSYLDKLLDTSFFSLKSKHFQLLLSQIKDKAKAFGLELRGRLFTSIDPPTSSSLKTKNPEKENINKVLKLEHKVNAQLDQNKEKESLKDSEGPSTPLTPDSELPSLTHENICVELLSMMKVRMDLAYAEIISRIGGPPALTVMTKASDATPVTSTPLPSMPTTPDESIMSLTFSKLHQFHAFDSEVYCLLEDAPTNHHFFSNKYEPTDMQRFFKGVQKEHRLLKDSLPPGVWVRAYTNRMDLLSVMIKGPSKTPYEDGLFLFDLQLSQDYPRSPPLCHYISYSSERLNPNLYVEGKVCISLLGTWMGRGTEMWSTNSTLLQLIVSIQGLILVSEPYYNEAGYEKQAKSQQGYENSRTYNELVVLKLVQSMTELLRAPPEVFKNEIYTHFGQHGTEMCERLLKWCSNSDLSDPGFPLRPVSKGLKLSLDTALEIFKTSLDKILETNKTQTKIGE